MSENNDIIEKKKVESAGMAYLLIGIVYLILFIVGIAAVASTIIKDKEYILIPVCCLIFFLVGMISLSLLTAYKEKQKFYIYSMEKNIVNFKELQEQYIQIKDTQDKLYFVRKEDYNLYSQYNLMHN